MSEKSKGDTSRIVNNPLLSASVTGLTFDDFPAAPLLLPAAPPIERSPPPVLDLNSDSKESLQGQGLNTDSDAFSEINLNATSDEDYNQPDTRSFISPLEEGPVIQDSSLLSQAASSFSQLPTVASTVFSTFSKVIKDYTPTNQINEDNGPISTDSPVLTSFNQFYSPESQNFDRNTPLGLPEQPQEPPKFYSPTEVPKIPSLTSKPNSNQNTYRLSAKKKTYAQIPGLSSAHHQAPSSLFSSSGTVASSLPPPPAITPPVQSQIDEQKSIPGIDQSYPNISNSGPVFNLQPSLADIQPYSEPATKKEERRGLFSLSTVVAPVWQNLSGLVGIGGSGQENQYGNSTTSQENYGSYEFVGTYTPAQPSTAQYFESAIPNPVPTAKPIPSNTGILNLPNPPSLVGTEKEYLTGHDKPQSNTFIGSIASQAVPNPPIQTFYTPGTIQPSPINLVADTASPSAVPLIPNNSQQNSQLFTLSSGPQINLSSTVQPPSAERSYPPLQATPPVVHDKATPPLNHPPPLGSSNTFRLQKGTRHYRAPLGISTNPTAESNLLQPITSSSPQPPILNQPFSPFSPGNPAQPQGVDLSVYAPSHQKISPPLVASLPHGSNLSVFNPAEQTLSSSQPPFLADTSSYQQATPIGTFPFAATAPPASPSPNNLPPSADILPYPPVQTQNFFPQPPLWNVNQSNSTLFDHTSTLIPQIEESTTKIVSVDDHSENFELGQEAGLETIENNTPIQDNLEKDISEIEKNFENLTVQSESAENQDIIQDKVQCETIEPAVASTLFAAPNEGLTFSVSSVSESKLTQPFTFDNVIQPQTTLNSNQTEFQEKQFIQTDLAESSYKLGFEKILPTENPEILQNTTNAPNVFNLTQYFTTQDNVGPVNFAQPPTDFNANQPNKTTQSVAAPIETQISAVNFFSPTYINDNSKNINPPSAFATNLPDPLSFFDSFQDPTSAPDSQVDENQNSGIEITAKSEIDTSFQIQNFFNNPPQNLNPSTSDLNYKLVGSNLIKKKYSSDNLSSTSRTISPLSNIVEPPSSACSEFSADTSSFQGTASNLISKRTNVDIPSDLNAETTENLDPEIMALLGSSKASTSTAVYQPAVKHWFYKQKVDEKYIWTPFSNHDSNLIETHFNDPAATKIVAVEGGRYDVNINDRLRVPIFWSGESTEVRRCSWFYKAVDSRYVPYEEAIADQLENEYEEAFNTCEWHRKIPLPTGETVVFHGATVLVHFLQTQSSDSWGATTQTTSRPRIVKRDLEDFNIESGESNKVDHLLFMVHGIGSVCDLKFRTVEEVVDEFRNIATQLIQSHYKNSCDSGRVGRVEVLPVSWHSELHSEESGVDEKLKAITLESIPKLRNFTNDTLLDILFYTSPVFCQNIMDTVAGTMNKVYAKYCQRNPSFNGGVSLAGHSLGSLILFDLLCHQKPIENTYIQNSENPDQPFAPLQIRTQTSTEEQNTTSKQVSYTIGAAGTGQANVSYPQLVFQPKMFFALGSPIGMFVTIRGIDRLGLDFKLPTCPGFYNIFHPYDPVAYRIEALVNYDLSTARPVLVPHHKGRKRMHLELKETMTRVGADIKQRIVDTFKNTFGTVYQLTAKKNQTNACEIEREVDKVLEMQLKMDKEPRSRTNSTSTHSEVDSGEIDLPLGKLNEGKRIDYVLQEAPLEFFNEYLFALTSHVCYWESADTILFLMKEIYSSLGVQTDSQVPQQSMTIERPQSSSLANYDHCENLEYNN